MKKKVVEGGGHSMEMVAQEGFTDLKVLIVETILFKTWDICTKLKLMKELLIPT